MKIGVIGAGQVGSVTAYACVLHGVGTEIVLVDRNEALVVAQAEDILHATPFAAPIPVRAGNVDDERQQFIRSAEILAAAAQQIGVDNIEQTACVC